MLLASYVSPLLLYIIVVFLFFFLSLFVLTASKAWHTVREKPLFVYLENGCERKRSSLSGKAVLEREKEHTLKLLKNDASRVRGHKRSPWED